MKKKFYQSEKFQRIFFPVLYFVLTIGIVITGCVIFYNKYYTPILVDGSSMMPTLVGGDPVPNEDLNYRCHYGIADLHKNSVNNLKRFDVIVTYYPSSWVSDPKESIIKRVWGFPGEKITLTYDALKYQYTFTASSKTESYKVTADLTLIKRKYEAQYYVGKKIKFKTVETSFTAAKWNVGNKTFYTNAGIQTRTIEKTLGKNEYFVMGDNWGHSTDSWTQRDSQDKLTKKYIQGRVVCINAYGTPDGNNDKAIHIHKIKERYNF